MTGSVASFRDRAIFWMVNLSVYLRHCRVIAQFRWRVGYCPNVAQPRRYSEKMLWRKLFDHNPAFVTFTDKLATKALQARLCPALARAAVLWTGGDAAQIAPAALERPAVIKANHGCGQNLFRRRGAAERPLKPRQLRRINSWLRRAYGQHQLEWAYRHAGRSLLVEALVLPPAGEPLLDLSVHAADGQPLLLEAIVANKTARQRKGYFHPDGSRWPELEPRRRDPALKPPLPTDFRLPDCYREALDHAGRLGAGVDYARFDFLAAGEQLYGGEIAVYPGSGLQRQAEFRAYNALLAARWDLTRSWFLTAQHTGWRQRYAAAFGRSLRAAEAAA